MSKKQSTSESTAKRTRRKFSDEYKIEAVKMVTEQGDKVAEGAYKSATTLPIYSDLL